MRRVTHYSNAPQNTLARSALAMKVSLWSFTLSLFTSPIIRCLVIHSIMRTARQIPMSTTKILNECMQPKRSRRNSAPRCDLTTGGPQCPSEDTGPPSGDAHISRASVMRTGKRTPLPQTLQPPDSSEGPGGAARRRVGLHSDDIKYIYLFRITVPKLFELPQFDSMDDPLFIPNDAILEYLRLPKDCTTVTWSPELDIRADVNICDSRMALKRLQCVRGMMRLTLYSLYGYESYTLEIFCTAVQLMDAIDYEYSPVLAVAALWIATKYHTDIYHDEVLRAMAHVSTISLSSVREAERVIAKELNWEFTQHTHILDRFGEDISSEMLATRLMPLLQKYRFIDGGLEVVIS